MTQYCLIAEREKFKDLVNTLVDMGIKIAPVRSVCVINLILDDESKLEELRKIPGVTDIVEPTSPTMKELMGEE